MESKEKDVLANQLAVNVRNLLEVSCVTSRCMLSGMDEDTRNEYISYLKNDMAVGLGKEIARKYSENFRHKYGNFSQYFSTVGKDRVDIFDVFVFSQDELVDLLRKTIDNTIEVIQKADDHDKRISG